MNTYKIHSTSHKRLGEISKLKRVVNVALVKYRLVVSTTSPLSEEELKGAEVLAEFQGDVFEDLASWASTNIVDEIHAQHLQLSRIPSARKRQQHIEAWRQAVERRRELEKQLAATKRDIEKKARVLLRAMGKGPINVDGVLFDPSHIRESVVYLRRPGQ